MPRIPTIVVALLGLILLPGCKQGKQFVASTLGNAIYGGLSQMGDTSRPANERGTAAMLDGTDAGLNLGRAIESQLPE